jgi:hypothetical protein
VVQDRQRLIHMPPDKSLQPTPGSVVRPLNVMRIVFGILSFCAAGLLTFWLVPVVDQVVLGYLLQDQSVGFSLMQFGPVHLYEGHICILAAVLVLFVIAFIGAGIYAFTSRDTKG